MRAASTGTTVKPTTSEQAWQKITTSASDLNSAPLTDCMNTSGMNTTQVVSVDASIAPATSDAPTAAASSGVQPVSSRLRTMFSSTTMALSTIIPTPSASPPKVIWFRVRPPKYSSAKQAMIEIGMDTPMMAVLVRLRRNRYRISSASSDPQ